MSITIPSHLSDADLDAALGQWRHDERRSTAHLLAHLAELDARRVHLKAGSPREPIRRARVTPLATDRYEVRFTAKAETRARLKLARGLSRHTVPSGDPAEIFDRALTALIDTLSRKKLAMKPFAAGGETTSANLQLRCRAHNACEAASFHGPMRPDSSRDELAEGP